MHPTQPAQRRRALNRYTGQTSTAPVGLAVPAVLLACLTLVAFASAARAAPSCAEGPQIVGDTYYGTPCDDTIRAPRNVTAIYGEGGDDTLYGQRGNDSLFGGEGNDRLFGGVGDDRLRGGPGDDFLSGGFGADSLDGEEGSDYVRGDATIDRIGDSGSSGVDTLSFATGVTPGFPNEGALFDEYSGFPEHAEGRGVYVDLEQGFANDGLAPSGGGVDEIEGEDFEAVVGTPFADFIVGSDRPEAIYGGGGPDVLIGGGGGDTIHGGAEGDSCQQATTTSECEGSGKEVTPRDPATVAAGDTYLSGSDANDALLASYSAGPPATVAFTVDGSPAGTIPYPQPPDSIVLAGLGGDDTLSATNFPATTSVILLGGEGDDHLTGGPTEDALVDGAGNDTVDAGAGDDAVPNNGGADHLHAGAGEDLFISNAICEGDLLDGGPDRDNANWANFGSAISIDLAAGKAGLVGAEGAPQCSSPSLLTGLEAIEDVEGSSGDDTLVGDAGENQLLGRAGHDSYFAAGGNDSILANSGDTDLTIDCGEGWDTALIDIPTHTATDDYEDPAPIECEDVEQRPKNSFRPPGTPPNPNPEPEPPVAKVSSSGPRDRTAPRTKLLHRPGKHVFTKRRWRRVAFALGSNEAGSSFRCRVDRKPFRPCRSPRVYNLGLGHHAFRAYAIDATGNRDRSPVVYRFTVRRLSAHSSRSHRRRGSTR
jgi:Ca2+-binding RTX toxin-like protein